ncbi:helix-turn-helix transcriptional regulator [Aestuariibacter salexigens]|uniref:helix-turn-helix transcriptional regulator n=1 Tax=Aestuariibacter salexigens TaxID=226010 RepID=UPI000428436D|nr:WYL domain-containing protein [Aestuariibacter salexigens]
MMLDSSFSFDKSKDHRSSDEKLAMKRQIASLTGIGGERGVTIHELLEQLQPFIKGNQTQAAFTKELHRLAQQLHSETYDPAEHVGFCIERQKGRSTLFYWTDEEEKDAYLNDHELTEARALALYVFEQQLREIFPQRLARQLEHDFSRAHEKLGHDDFKLARLFEISHFGLQNGSESRAPAEQNESSLETLFVALTERKAISIEYAPVFTSQKIVNLTLSPQRIRYITNHLYLQAYDHDAQALSNYDMSRIKAVDLNNSANFHAVDFSEYKVTVPFKARCNSWVKHYLQSSNFAEDQHFSKVENDIWELNIDITLPKDAPDKDPNPTLLADFLGMFVDAIELLEPKILRSHMISRAGKLALLYSLEDQREKFAALRNSSVGRSKV